jgi:hypothetical protein
MLGGLGLGLEHGRHDLFEQLDGKPFPALGERAVGHFFAGESIHMLGEGARPCHDTEDHAFDQFWDTDYGRTAPTHAARGQQRTDCTGGDCLFEQTRECGKGDEGFGSHPQVDARLSKFAHGKHCLGAMAYALSQFNSQTALGLSRINSVAKGVTVWK